ncbi:MAG: hypothetical protein ISR68_02400 [Campylobacterales bacterium]|nr:hypothetical protein [Campylobacterales bacterium]
MKKELNIYIGIFLFLAIGMHFKQWIDHPIEHLMNMPSGGAFGVPGIAHPFVFTLVVYLVVYLFRSIGSVFSKSK